MPLDLMVLLAAFLTGVLGPAPACWAFWT